MCASATPSVSPSSAGFERISGLREWFSWAADGEFTEDECRDIVRRTVGKLSLSELESEYHTTYGEDFDLDDWKQLRLLLPIGGSSPSAAPSATASPSAIAWVSNPTNVQPTGIQAAITALAEAVNSLLSSEPRDRRARRLVKIAISSLLR